VRRLAFSEVSEIVVFAGKQEIAFKILQALSNIHGMINRF
jgi:hypothetical protein